ncbi:MAG: hypothetical protein M3P08_20085 [Thermoproteota archaeon]|nr:hypothetical protein [Thermoproteota archaeon]
MAASVMDHAANFEECGFFLITRMNRIGSDYEINFVVSDAANSHAIDLSSKILKICTETGANYNTVEETVKKLNQTNILHLKKLRKLTEEVLNNIEQEPTRNTGPCIISGTFTGLLDEQVREFASRKISESNLVVVLTNLNSELDSMANEFISSIIRMVVTK